MAEPNACRAAVVADICRWLETHGEPDADVVVTETADHTRIVCGETAVLIARNDGSRPPHGEDTVVAYRWREDARPDRVDSTERPRRVARPRIEDRHG